MTRRGDRPPARPERGAGYGPMGEQPSELRTRRPDIPQARLEHCYARHPPHVRHRFISACFHVWGPRFDEAAR